MKKVNVAISLSLPSAPGQGIWSSGANQHCVFLYQLLRHSPLVDQIWLVHRDDSTQCPPAMLMDDIQPVLRPVSTVLDQVDLFIEMTSSLVPEQAERLRHRNAKLVSYRFGNEYVVLVEQLTFNSHNWSFNPLRIQFDEVWTNAQHEYTCKSFFETALRAPVFVLPHPWSPYFLERGLLANPKVAPKWGYRNHGAAKRVAVFEPNINVVKSVLIPMLAANEFYRRHPDLLEHLFLCNTQQMKDNFGFNRMAHGLEVVRERKTSATHRHPFFQFAASCTDVVLSHQWQNGLNYLYYEALYGGYPLVHNSPFLRDVGYYYEGFDIQGATNALARAVTTHDEDVDRYRENARLFLEKVSVSSHENVEAYTQRIDQLFAGTRKASDA
ncbi:hypothetical protein AQ914_04605 [Burkholderia pseudomallei]|uniref:DUF2827 family protein n=1 Tax=Burkholderia pseudomallei TaxID=28450 RepID=UPI0009764612|nr:DUF2827 family protein [Burkholderia pseudomallei]ONC26366.1 hypothetical protein AQ914_04605 [Burkholderia pseudomallei]